jgi:uncharacterized protein YjbJ (UPF0337 family)
MSGDADKAKGHVKQAVGELTDDERLEREGKADELAGKAKNVADKAKDAADDVAGKAKDAIDDARDKLTGKN